MIRDGIIEPCSPVEELLFLLHRNRIPVSIADTAIIRDGVLRGLFYCTSTAADSVIVHDPGWPVVDYDTHQTRMYSTKRASEAAAKVEVAVNFFSKDCSTPEVVPVVMHIGCKSNPGKRQENSKVDVTCQFFTKSRFTELLRSTKIPDGLICRYHAPENRHHHLIRVVFTPFAVLTEQHEAAVSIDCENAPLAERVSVSPGNPGSFEVVSPSEVTKQYARRISSRFFQFFREQGAAMDRAIFFLTQPSPDRCLFMWAGSIELKPWYLDPNFACSDAISQNANISQDQLLTSQSQPDTVPQQRDQSTAGDIDTPLQHSPTEAAHRRLLCPSPILPAQQLDFQLQLLADVKDFGFYSDESQRLRDSLKRQIRSICRVEKPPSMLVDDTPPYDDEFIAALCHPEKAETYFFGGFAPAAWKGRRGTQLCRSKSKIFRFIEAGKDEDSIGERSAMFEKSMGSFRRVRSGSVAPSDSSQFHLAATQSSTLRNTSAVLDPELSRILVDHVNDIDNVQQVQELFTTAIPRKNQETVQAIEKLRPDWKHSGHIARIRRKYATNDFTFEEDEAEVRRVAALRAATSKASQSVEMRLQAQLRSREPLAKGVVASGSTQPNAPSVKEKSRVRASSATMNRPSNSFFENLRMSRPGDSREAQWCDVLHQPHERKAPFRKLVQPPKSLTQPLLSKVIPKYDSKLAEGSLMGYLVGTEKFERQERLPVLDVPLDDCERKRNAGTYASEAAAPVPDPPLAQLTNLHLSLSEEIIRGRSTEAPRVSSRSSKRISMMEMLFGRYNDSDDVERRDYPDANSTAVVHSRSKASVASFTEIHGSDGDSSELDESNNSFLHPQQTYTDQLQRSADKDEKKLRQMNLQRHGISDSKEKVLIIVGTFEDLVYQWVSDPANDLKKASKTFAPQVIMKLHVPPAFFHLRKELRSLMVSIGFREDSVEAISIPAYQQAITDELLDEVPQYVKIFSMHVSPVTVSRVLSAAKMFAADVASLYADCRWDVIERIREMTEIQGFTFVDAVLMVTPGNLMERSCVSKPVLTFADIKS